MKRYRGRKECKQGPLCHPPKQGHFSSFAGIITETEAAGGCRAGDPELSDINPLAAVLSRGLRDPRGARRSGQWSGALREPLTVPFFPTGMT